MVRGERVKTKFKVGDQVKISASERKRMRERAWDMNKVPDKGILEESQAISYFMDMAIGLGFRYSAKIVGKCRSNFHVLKSVKGIETTEHFSPDDLIKL